MTSRPTTTAPRRISSRRRRIPFFASNRSIRSTWPRHRLGRDDPSGVVEADPEQLRILRATVVVAFGVSPHLEHATASDRSQVHVSGAPHQRADLVSSHADSNRGGLVVRVVRVLERRRARSSAHEECHDRETPDHRELTAGAVGTIARTMLPRIRYRAHDGTTGTIHSQARYPKHPSTTIDSCVTASPCAAATASLIESEMS